MLEDGLFKRFGKPDMGFALHDGAHGLWRRVTIAQAF